MDLIEVLHPFYQVQVVLGNVDIGVPLVKRQKWPTQSALTETSIFRKPPNFFMFPPLKPLKGSYQGFKTLISRFKDQKHLTLASKFVTKPLKSKTIDSIVKPT